MDEATSSKMLDDSFGTQIQNCLNVNAITQDHKAYLHHLNIQNTIHIHKKNLLKK